MNLERDLRRAIEREELEVHYQPKVLLETGAIAGAEAPCVGGIQIGACCCRLDLFHMQRRSVSSTRSIYGS